MLSQTGTTRKKQALDEKHFKQGFNSVVNKRNL